uniref:Uncharacterized protein n=1 Tax=Anopheles maculatus TaxID=74869 RepID=A0A182T9P9_9DIPT
MEPPASLTTGSVFPVRPSLDHLLAMGEDDDEEEEEKKQEETVVDEMKEKPVLVHPTIVGTGGVATDHCAPVPENSAQIENGESTTEVDDDEDDGASELTELQQLPDTQQPAGTAKEQNLSFWVANWTKVPSRGDSS